MSILFLICVISVIGNAQGLILGKNCHKYMTPPEGYEVKCLISHETDLIGDGCYIAIDRNAPGTDLCFLKKSQACGTFKIFLGEINFEDF